MDETCPTHLCCKLGTVGSHEFGDKSCVCPERGILLSNTEDKSTELNTEQDVQNNISEQGPVSRKPLDKLWLVLAGGIGGAVIVGAVWGLIAHGQQNDPLVATVGAHQIHQSDFEAQMESMAGQQTLQQMIDNQLIKDGAKAQNITASKQDISTALQNLESQYGISSSAQLTQFLQTNGITQTQLNDILTVNVLEQKLSEQGITVTNTEIQNYYNQNKASFTPQGSKTPEPLSMVKSQIEQQLKQSKAVPSTQLLANLAKKEKVTVYNTKYSSIQTQLENPTPTPTPTNSVSGP